MCLLDQRVFDSHVSYIPNQRSMGQPLSNPSFSSWINLELNPD